MVKIATFLWEREDTKQQICQFLELLETTNRKSDIYLEKKIMEWNIIRRDVISHINNLNLLPPQLKSRLKHIARSMGLQIFSWIKYMENVLFLDKICIDDIFWTHYGTLDKIKIFKSWVEKKKFSPAELFNVACFFYLEDYIPSLWNEIPEEVKKGSFYRLRIHILACYSHIAYWKNILLGRSYFNFETSVTKAEFEIKERSRINHIKYDKEFEDGFYINEFMSSIRYSNLRLEILGNKMMWLSLTQGNEFAMEYYWNMMDDKREENLQNYITSIFNKDSLPEYAASIIFLITKMFMKDYIQFSVAECFGLLVLLSNCPWDEFFLPVLDRVTKCYPTLAYGADFEKERLDFLNVLEKIVDLMENEFHLYGTVEGSVYQHFLHEFWKRFPTWAKFWNVDWWNKRFRQVLAKLLKTESTKSLKIFFFSEDFCAARYENVKIILSLYLANPIYVLTMTNNHAEYLQQFVKDMELNEQETMDLISWVDFRFKEVVSIYSIFDQKG